MTLDEFVAAAEALLAECDKDKSGELDEKETAGAINLFFPPPGTFGPPQGPAGGFRPGDPPKPAKLLLSKEQSESQ